MSWSIEPFVGNTEDLTDHDFVVETGSTAHEINDREHQIIEVVKDGIEAIAEATGGHLSISAFGSHAQIPSPGDTTVIYISYVPDPSQAGSGVISSGDVVAGSSGATMTTQEALNTQAEEARQNDDQVGPSEGLQVGNQVQADLDQPVIDETVAVIDPASPETPSQGTPTSDPGPSVPPQLAVPEQPAPVAPPIEPAPAADGQSVETPLAPVDPVASAPPVDPGTPAVPVGDPPLPPVDPTVPAPDSAPPSTIDTSTPSPEAPPVVPAEPDLTNGLSGSSDAPPSSDSPSAPPADIPPSPSADPAVAADPTAPATPPATAPDPGATLPVDIAAPVSPVDAPPVIVEQAAGQMQSLETGAGMGPDDAAARVAAQIAENPVDPKPLYWVDQGVAVDPAFWTPAPVLAANGALLYNFLNDTPGGEPTGAPEGSSWHVYVGATQPAPGTPEAAATPSA